LDLPGIAGIGRAIAIKVLASLSLRLSRHPAYLDAADQRNVSAVFLDLRLDITNACLDLAGVLLDLSFQFQLFVADDMTGDFFHFAFGFFVPTFDLLFVHVSILSMS
jgi:hypothetical protein